MMKKTLFKKKASYLALLVGFSIVLGSCGSREGTELSSNQYVSLTEEEKKKAEADFMKEDGSYVSKDIDVVYEQGKSYGIYIDRLRVQEIEKLAERTDGANYYSKTQSLFASAYEVLNEKLYFAVNDYEKLPSASSLLGIYDIKSNRLVKYEVALQAIDGLIATESGVWLFNLTSSPYALSYQLFSNGALGEKKNVDVDIDASSYEASQKSLAKAGLIDDFTKPCQSQKIRLLKDDKHYLIIGKTVVCLDDSSKTCSEIKRENLSGDSGVSDAVYYGFYQEKLLSYFAFNDSKKDGMYLCDLKDKSKTLISSSRQTFPSVISDDGILYSFHAKTSYDNSCLYLVNLVSKEVRYTKAFDLLASGLNSLPIEKGKIYSFGSSPYGLAIDLASYY
jgi:hypothetical protein